MSKHPILTVSLYKNIADLTLDNILLGNKVGGMPMIGVKKSFFIKIGGLSTKLKSLEDYEFILKEITIQETSPYESRLNLLASVISISPMLGLLGTVTGMIRAFTNISKYGAGDAAIVADGIAEALLTTAAGLMIAIPVIVVYNYLNRRLEKMENEIDDVVTNIINIFRR